MSGEWMRGQAFLGGVALSLALMNGPAASAPLNSFLPKTDLGQFIVDKLDLASFPSILGPRVMASQHTFAGMKLKPATASANEVTFDDDDYYVKIDVLGRGDFNDDGLEDIIVCWRDQAKGGTYRTTTPYLLTRYSADTPLVAIAAHAPSRPACDPDPPLSKR